MTVELTVHSPSLDALSLKSVVKSRSLTFTLVTSKHCKFEREIEIKTHVRGKVFIWF